jgi:hypothetical protein
MSSRWVTLFQGTLPEVITLQSTCEASGIPTYVPDMSLMQADPFMRGGNALALELFVPEDRLVDARTLVPQRNSPGAEPRDPLDVLGSRVRWCILLMLTAPIGIWLGLRYLRATRGLDPKPREHARTVRSFWLCVLLTLAGIVVYGKLFLDR